MARWDNSKQRAGGSFSSEPTTPDAATDKQEDSVKEEVQEKVVRHKYIPPGRLAGSNWWQSRLGEVLIPWIGMNRNDTKHRSQNRGGQNPLRTDSELRPGSTRINQKSAILTTP